jgi:transcriptional regulator with GAF, ATPase, and Fis domain
MMPVKMDADAVEPAAIVAPSRFGPEARLGRRPTPAALEVVRSRPPWPGDCDRAGSTDGPLVFPKGYIPGRSPAILALYGQIQALLRGDVPVLFLGETGVGKEQLAHVLHSSSARRRGPFVAVNCAAIPAELMEAEMFGIAKGVATGVNARPGQFQLADGGTLFLDEIGDMPPALQAKLLRALQGKEVQPVGGPPVRVDARVVTATNSDLSRRIEEGRFRRDLYYRVAGFVLRVPPLRERREDIPWLVESLLGVFAGEIGKSIRGMTASALRALAAYEWPGNVRELEHEVRRLAYLCGDGQAVDCGLLSEHVLGSPDEEQTRKAPLASLALEPNLEQLERQLIRTALASAGGKRAAAARMLGISRNGLAMKMERLCLTAEPIAI